MSGVDLDGLPDGAYLAWRYVDRRGGIDRGQVYWDDGRVEAIEDGRSEELCRFDARQVAAARAAIAESGIAAAGDRPRAGSHDTAALTYWWLVDGRPGRLANDAYPIEQPAEVDRLEARLAELEEEAGGWPLDADE